MAEADPLEGFIETAATILDLPLAPEWKPAIRSNLKVILDHGERVSAFTLPDDAEPAPTFEA